MIDEIRDSSPPPNENVTFCARSTKLGIFVCDQCHEILDFSCDKWTKLRTFVAAIDEIRQFIFAEDRRICIFFPRENGEIQFFSPRVINKIHDIFPRVIGKIHTLFT